MSHRMDPIVGTTCNSNIQETGEVGMAGMRHHRGNSTTSNSIKDIKYHITEVADQASGGEAEDDKFSISYAKVEDCVKNEISCSWQ